MVPNKNGIRKQILPATRSSVKHRKRTMAMLIRELPKYDLKSDWELKQIKVINRVFK